MTKQHGCIPRIKHAISRKCMAFKDAIESEMQETNLSPTIHASSESESDSSDRSLMTNLFCLGVETADTATN